MGKPDYGGVNKRPKNNGLTKINVCRVNNRDKWPKNDVDKNKCL